MQESEGYHDLRGLMTWSINWDAVNTCSESYEFADNFELIFGNTTNVPITESIGSLSIWPNPASGEITLSAKNRTGANIFIKDVTGKTVFSGVMKNEILEINISEFKPGFYFVNIDNHFLKLIRVCL